MASLHENIDLHPRWCIHSWLRLVPRALAPFGGTGGWRVVGEGLGGGVVQFRSVATGYDGRQNP